MLTLIAESKTMLEQELPVSRECYEANTPAGEAFADETMARVAGMDVADIAAAIKISPAMAAKVIRMAYEFPNKQTGLRAIDAFTGVVFKNFDYPSLSPEEKERTAENVRIISSLYGWLCPEDIIKPYRFDFTTPLAPEDKTFAAWWKKDVTIQLVRQLKATGEKNILNLLPADAAKCIDWKLVKNFAKVWKVDFKEQDGSAVRTPHAGKLNALRGHLLRQIITQDIDTPAPL
ncbi:MAG: YaaA family protein, partial [Muribaculaceae bacterium]|nr:YaaA family protein [Muribaculaceae bacterium]